MGRGPGGRWRQPGASLRTHGPAEPALILLLKMLVPLGALAAVYLLWQGADEPGGAFQAGTEQEEAAANAYMVLSIRGETSLLLGLIRAVTAAGSVRVADIPPALAGEGAHALTQWLLFSGFAIKAGQWYPPQRSAGCDAAARKRTPGS